MKKATFSQKNKFYSMLNKIGKFLFLIPFLVFGIFHFLNGAALAQLVPEWLPGDMFVVYLTGAGLILAPIAVLINKWGNLALLLLSIMLLLFVATLHLPAVLGGDQMAMSALLKDLSLAGGALLLRK